MNLERIFERVLFASRWLLAPIYLGLGLLLVVLVVAFFHVLLGVALNIWRLRDVDVIVQALTLVDLSLVAGLTVMVMLSGYENFVSRLDVAATEKSIAWLGKLDSGTLKLKVAVSIVAISAIQLLKNFMDAQEVADDKLLWMTIIHLTFVVTAVALTFSDRIIGADRR